MRHQRERVRRLALWLVIVLAICAAALAQGERAQIIAVGESPVLTRGPYLGNQTTTSVQIIWNTDVLTDGVVQYGLALPYTQQVTSPIVSTTQVVTLQGFSRIRSIGTASSEVT